MPHQCTTCGRTFPDGSKEMLSGCPDCGGNKFQFKPAGETTDEQSSPATDEQPSPATDEQPSPAENKPSNTDRQSPDADRQSTSTGEGGASVTDDSTSVSRQPETQTPDSRGPESEAPDAQPIDSEQADSEHVRERTHEDVAQASARSDVVSPDELDRASRGVETGSSSTGSGPDAPADPEEPRPDIDDLRDELNEQFESIRIVSPGKYELNLMELYDRQEYIISLQEDGRYVIEMPDAWGISDE
ncbi:Zn-ribbon domain-containing protein [Halorubrum amylolyticum]|uniref:Zn-ribbon domain-containing protein n=1 Tax=Halorubrum amylolyticum TaxID=2508724 RepID=UPI0010091E1B|nr:Zn-ribbon containing protein [Halorubrum amylolyticum]